MKRRKHKNTEGTSYWQSYSDMMAALLLIFVLIMSFTLFQSLRHYQEMSESIEESKHAYDEQQKELESQTKKAEEQQKVLESQTLILEEQSKKVEEQQKKMDEQQEKIDNLIGVKADLIKALSAEFTNTDMAIEVDQQTGAIVFDSNVLFDFGRYSLKSDAKSFLKTFFPKYFRVLMSDDFEPYISEIIIEGYTDNSGTFVYNLELSQKRALAIAQYCLDKDHKLLNDDELAKLEILLTANGRSYNNLKYKEDGKVDTAASRRVEFKFRLKDEEMIEEMQKILEK